MFYLTVIGQIAAQTLVSDKDYGLAISYCISAEDWRGLGRIVDRVLDEYITNGMNAGVKCLNLKLK
jgi:nuclear pore complex protein Nup85